jgi:type I restriction enzyme S subunit
VNAPTKTESSALARRAGRRDRAPADWRERRLRFALSLNPSWREAAHLKDEDEVSFVPMEAVGEFGGLDLSATKPIGDIGAGFTFFADGDVVVAKITPCFENGKGALARNLRNGVAFGTTELHVLRANPTELCPEYLFYLSISQPFRAFGESSMYGAGGQKRVAEDFLKNFRWLLPPLSEQRAIAAFLDRETARIDALIKKKRRLIELLQEKRAAVITRAVTRGLSESVPVVAADVAWLPELPNHWRLVRLRDVAALQTGPFGSQLHAHEYVDDGVPVINPANVDDGRLVMDRECTVKSQRASELSRHALRTGDILFGRRGEMGRCGLVAPDQDGWICGTGCLRARPDETRVLGSFLNHYMRLRAIAEYLGLHAVGSTMQNLNTSLLGRIPVALPPIEEQRSICERLDARLAAIGGTVASVAKAMERLSEYRSALIAAAVTGQIDVREAA